MSLSSSTLNLKFMQRAAARNAQSNPASTPSTPNAGPSQSAPSRLGSISTPQASTSSLLNTQTPDSKATFTPIIGVQAEHEAQARWHISRPTRPSLPTRQSSETGRIRFEPSYLPFLISGTEGEAGPSRVKSARAGGGRMAFGGFGEEDKEEEGEGGDTREEGKDVDGMKVKKVKKDHKGDHGGVRDSNKGLVMGVKREHPSTPTAPPPESHTTSKGFQRPSNYTPDIPKSTSTSFSRPHRPRAENISDVKPSIPASPKPNKKDSVANNTSGKKRALLPLDAGSEGTKRAKMDLSRSTPNGKVTVKVDLDAREREMKAAKKREKKAKRKAKIEAE